MKYSRLFILALTIFLSVGILGCKEDELSAQLLEEIEIIDQYLLANGIDAIEHKKGIRYIIHERGSGRSPSKNDVISFTYAVRNLGDPEPFEEADSPVAYQLSGLIKGWQIAIPKLQEGGSMTLYVPSSLAYGDSNNLQFEIGLHGVY